MENYNDLTTTYYPNGKIQELRYFLNKKLHRLDGPAIVRYFPDGKIEEEYYLINHTLHRIDGPARRFFDKNGRLIQEEYFLNNKTHRIDGPARIWYGASEKLSHTTFYINGKYVPMLDSFLIMTCAVNKTETFCDILKRERECKYELAILLSNIFKKDLDQKVVENLTLFL